MEKLLVYNRRLFKKFSDVELYDDNRFNNYINRIVTEVENIVQFDYNLVDIVKMVENIYDTSNDDITDLDEGLDYLLLNLRDKNVKYSVLNNYNIFYLFIEGDLNLDFFRRMQNNGYYVHAYSNSNHCLSILKMYKL